MDDRRENGPEASDGRSPDRAVNHSPQAVIRLGYRALSVSLLTATIHLLAMLLWHFGGRRFYPFATAIHICCVPLAMLSCAMALIALTRDDDAAWGCLSLLIIFAWFVLLFVRMAEWISSGQFLIG